MSEGILPDRFAFPRAFVSALVLAGLFRLVCGAAEPNFKAHLIEKDCPLVDDSVMCSTLSDLDGDGDLDWTVGTVFPRQSRPRMLYWYEYQGSGKWYQHRIGEIPDAYGGACVADVNSDGHLDVVATDLWLNLGRAQRWTFRRTGLPRGVHDMQAVDMDGNGRVDFLVFDQTEGLVWYEVPKDLSTPWIGHPIAPADYAGMRVHACAAPKAAADLDGDGDTDVAAVQGWFENTDGAGLRWKYHKNDLFPHGTVGSSGDFPWGLAVRTVVLDVDADGDMDIVQSGCDTRAATSVVWLENTDGKGDFQLHRIKGPAAEDYHTLRVIDYDNDGDWDIFTGCGPLAQSKHAFLLENLSGKGNKPERWKEHVVYTGVAVHESVAGDVDGDGDVDLIIKPWNARNTRKDFVYLENLLVCKWQ